MPRTVRHCCPQRQPRLTLIMGQMGMGTRTVANNGSTTARSVFNCPMPMEMWWCVSMIMGRWKQQDI